MPFLFPSQQTAHAVLFMPSSIGSGPAMHAKPSSVEQKKVPLPAHQELYTTWSVVDDAKSKANALSAEATKEFEKASVLAQEKAGHIELYSPKYYAACTFGGLMACVSTFRLFQSLQATNPDHFRASLILL